MKIQTLVSTMNRDNYDFLNSMNIRTEVVLGNQNGENSQTVIDGDFGKIKVICSSKKGLSNNRNTTLLNSDADICILADDDIEYLDNYESIIRNAFLREQDADVIIFNLYEKPIQRYVIKKRTKINKINFLRFGSVRIAFKRRKIIESGIRFDPNFGAGAVVPMGEDAIFLHDCLTSNLNVIGIPEYILKLKNDRGSSWFSGYNTSYFENKGKLYRRMFPISWKGMCLQDAIRHSKKYEKKWNMIFRIMLIGGKKQALINKE